MEIIDRSTYAKTEAEAFLLATPEYYVCPYNFWAIMIYGINHGLVPNRTSLARIYKVLSARNKLKRSRDEEEPRTIICRECGGTGLTKGLTPLP
jgi:hypothetical protein